LKVGVIGAAEIAAVQRQGGGVGRGKAGGGERGGVSGDVKEEQMEEDGEEEGEEAESSDGEDDEEEAEQAEEAVEGEGGGGGGRAAGGDVDALFQGGVSSWLEEGDEKTSRKGATAARLGSELDAISDLLPSVAAQPAPASRAPTSKTPAAPAVLPAGKGEDVPMAAAAAAEGARGMVKGEPLTLADAVKRTKKKKKSKAEQ
ncbi:hypothetical protein CLOP_g16292, partial [Closterium sp. NIES-67]